MARLSHPTIDLYRDSEGQWRWRFIAANGRILADSGQGYTAKRDAIRGLEFVTGGTYDPTYPTRPSLLRDDVDAFVRVTR